MIRVSGVAPSVANRHQTASTSGDACPRRAACATSWRGLHPECQQRRTAAMRLLRSLRLGRVDLDLDPPVLGVVCGSSGSAGRSQPMPGGRELVRLQRRELLDQRLLDRVGAVLRQLLDQRSSGTWPFIDASVWPSMTMRAAPYWPASLPTSSSTKSTFGIVQLLDSPCRRLADDLLRQVPASWGRSGSRPSWSGSRPLSAWIALTRLGAN